MKPPRRSVVQDPSHAVELAGAEADEISEVVARPLVPELRQQGKIQQRLGPGEPAPKVRQPGLDQMVEGVDLEGLRNLGLEAVGIADGFDAPAAQPGQPHALVQGVQDAKGGVGAPQRHPGGQQTLAAAIKQGLEVGLGQGLGHEPVRDPVDEIGAARRYGLYSPGLSPARHAPLRHAAAPPAPETGPNAEYGGKPPARTSPSGATGNFGGNGPGK